MQFDILITIFLYDQGEFQISLINISHSIFIRQFESNFIVKLKAVMMTFLAPTLDLHDNYSLYLAFEYLDKGDLLTFLRNNKDCLSKEVSSIYLT